MDVKDSIGYGLRPAGNEIEAFHVGNYARVLVRLGIVHSDAVDEIFQTSEVPAHAYDRLYDLEMKASGE